jgi:hypothetical protein
LHRRITTYRYAKDYEEQIKASILEFFAGNKLPHLEIRYEDLIQHPAETISSLNRFLGTSLTVDDLRSVYRKPLYKNPRSSMLDILKAVLIYLKNYHERKDKPVKQNT